jgi:potassium-transporting ATPase KdpC subunit
MKHVRSAVAVLLFWTLAVGGLYPLFVTGIAAVFFPGKARGSLVVRDGVVRGSTWIGQGFDTDPYFHPRPSTVDYGTMPSGAGNQGYTSAALRDAVLGRKAAWEKSNGTAEIPMEMLFASGSGLDPHIGPRSAALQIPRVMKARGIPAARGGEVRALVDRFTEGPQFGFLGEARVDVLSLNLALDEAFPR